MSNVGESVEIKVRPRYWDHTAATQYAVPGAINTIPAESDLYDKEKIFEKARRSADKLWVANDGADNLYVRYATEGVESFSDENVIPPKEYKVYYNVFELRLRSPTAGLPYRISEFEIEPCCTKESEAFSAGVSTGCNSLGITGTVSNQLVLCGGSNVTLSESISGQSATITIIGGAGTTFSAGVSNLSNDFGSTGIVTNQIVFVGGNNITLSQSSNIGGSATITVIGPNTVAQSIQPSLSAGMSDLGYTAGDVGLVSNQLIFVGGSNVTLSQSINGQSATLTIDVANQTVQPDMHNILSAGSQLANTSGTVLFDNANSISFGMNNSSVITAQYELKSHSSNYHTSIIGAESQITFDPVAGHDHDGVDSKLIITPQYLEVSEIAGVGESGKQFTSIVTALAAAVAGGADVTKPYVIKVYPGIYTEAPFTMVPYVAIIGSGEFNTIIRTSDLTQNFITGAINSYIRDCSVVGPTTIDTAAFYHNAVSSSPFVIQDVLIRQGYYGVWADSAITGGNVHCINVNNWYNGTSMHTFMRATNYGTIVAMSSGFMCGLPGKVTRGFACVGPNAEIYMDLCYFRNDPTGNPNDGLFVDDGGKVKLVACTFTRGTNAIHIGANGTGGYVIAVGCNIRNEPAMGYTFVTDILMDNAGTLQYTGSCTKTKITITNPGAVTFSANFTDSTTLQEGTVTVGEAWLGFSVANSIPLRDYGLNAYSTGWRALGQVTRAGLLDLSVAAGSGYINTGAGVTKITWDAVTPISCTANSTQWIYVNSAGVVAISLPGAEPNYPDVIMLAVTRTDGTNVTFLANHNILLQQSLPSNYDFIEKVFGSISTEGCTVTQAPGVGDELKVDFTTGKYYFGLHKLQPASTPSIPFTYWYRKVGSSGWNTATPGGGGSDFDTTQYDNNTGFLAPLPGGKYKKDLLFVVKNDVGTEFHVIYGQHIFDTLDQARADTGFEIPDAFEDYALKLYGIVVLSGAGIIAGIVDDKKKFISAHSELKDLQGGNSASTQYYHLDYNDYSSRNQKIVASLLTAGNTAGVMGVISTGTMYLAGGNNVTLSQNANSVTISGANIAISASNATTTATMFTFGNTPGLSFQISGGSVVGSLGNFMTSQSNQALSGSNGSFAFQTATFGNSNGLLFYITNGSMVGSYTVPTQTIGLTDTTAGGGTGGTGGYASGNAVKYAFVAGSNITLSQSLDAGSLSGTLSIYAPNPTAAGIGAIGDTASSNAFTSGSVIFSASTNITINTSANGASQYIQLSVADPAAALGVSAIANSETTYTSGLLILSEYTNITISSSVNGGSQYYRFSVGAGAGIGGIADSASTVTNQTVQFNNANSISFGLNGSTMTASYSQSIQTQSILSPLAIIGNTAGTNYTLQNGQYSWSADNNITLSQNSSNTNIIVISGANTHAQQTGISGIADSATTVTAGTVQFANLNGISFGLNGDTMTASHNALTSQSTGIGGLYASGIATTFTSGSVGFSGSNNITISTAAQAIIISGPNTHAVQVGISSIGATNTTYTSGGVSLYGSGIISISSTSGQGFVISAPGVVSLNGSSSTLTIMAGNNMSISNVAGASQISIINLLSTSAIARDVTTGSSSGTLTARFAMADHAHRGVGVIYASGANGANSFYGPMTIATGNTNITLSTGASALSIHGPTPGGGVAIADYMAGSTVSNGTVQFSFGNNVNFGFNGSTMTASALVPAIGISTGGNTCFATSMMDLGSIVLQGGNNITLCLTTATNQVHTIEIIGAGGAALSYFENFGGINLQPFTPASHTGGTGNIYISYQRIHVPTNLVVDEVDMIYAMSGDSNSSGAFTISGGFYSLSLNSSSAVSSFINSRTTSFYSTVNADLITTLKFSNVQSWTSGSSLSAFPEQYVAVSGTHYFFAPISQSFGTVYPVTIPQGEYLFAFMVSQDMPAASLSIYGLSSLNIDSLLNIYPNNQYFHKGYISQSNISTSGLSMPLSIVLSEITQNGSSVLAQPYFFMARGQSSGVTTGTF